MEGNIGNPLVSIIIPVYNGGNYLKEAIDSALSQTYSNCEVLVINDGSCDEGITEKIALSYGEKIRYFSKENGGVATALNMGIKNMKGEYFSWLSHDDMYYPNKVEKQMEALYKNGDMTKIVYSGYDLLETESQIITNVSLEKTYDINQLTNSIFPVLQGLIHGCALLIHKSHFERVGAFNENLITTQDYDLWFRMLHHQNTIYIKESLVIGRLHEEQGSKTLECHDKERCELHLNFLKILSEEEICSMYETAYNFYHRMSCFFKGGNMKEAYIYANQKFQGSDIPKELTGQLKELENYIKKLSNGQARRICIFGAGDYGLRLYHELRSKLIYIDCFSDNDQKKWGYVSDNTYCISPEQLEKEKDETLVIVANRTPDAIVDQLRKMNFPHIITKQEIDSHLFKVPPVKWITTIDDLKGLDYSSKEILSLIDKFNQTIFDICKYYEDRLSNN